MERHFSFDGFEAWESNLVSQGWEIEDVPAYDNWRHPEHRGRSSAKIYLYNTKLQLLGRVKYKPHDLQGMQELGYFELDYLKHDKNVFGTIKKITEYEESLQKKVWTEHDTYAPEVKILTPPEVLRDVYSFGYIVRVKLGVGTSNKMLQFSIPDTIFAETKPAELTIEQHLEAILELQKPYKKKQLKSDVIDYDKEHKNKSSI